MEDKTCATCKYFECTWLSKHCWKCAKSKRWIMFDPEPTYSEWTPRDKEKK